MDKQIATGLKSSSSHAFQPCRISIWGYNINSDNWNNSDNWKQSVIWRIYPFILNTPRSYKTKQFCDESLRRWGLR